MTDLSVIIPARNEEFLGQTINDVLAHIGADTEIIAILDGYWPDPAIQDHPRVTLVHHSESIGQRAAVNEGARMSRAKYIMKLDAHCAVDKRFDVKLMADCDHDWTVIPKMYNLHVFDWVCGRCGHQVYQGPKPATCEACSEPAEFKKKIVWQRRLKRHTEFWRFDKKLKFQYWHVYNKRPAAKPDIADTMSSIGACFFMERARFFDIDGMDEDHGGWGQMGTELACKSWLSGGRQVVNKKTWFAHMFRTNNKGFSFPYPLSGKHVKVARAYSRKLWIDHTWPKAIHKLDWLVEKFAPVPDWHPGETTPDKLEDSKKPTENINMQTPKLSVIIPARNEKYLQATVDDLIKNLRTKEYEIIVGLDNYEPEPILQNRPRMRIHKVDRRIGMRPMINQLAELARGRYIMKTDAHCAFAEGYDKALIDIHEKGDTVLGIRYELDVATWQRRERTDCDFRYLSHPDKDPKGGLRGLAWDEYKKRSAGLDVAESMSLSGSGWLMEKAQFDAWGGLDENHGTFGQEGAEIACKTWLSGGRLRINRNTWYAHWNRGKAPYALSTTHRQKSIDYSIKLWMGDRWPLQKYSFNWLIEHFAPVPGWEIEDKGLAARRQGTLFKSAGNMLVAELWDLRIGIAEPLKRWRIKIFYDTFAEMIEWVKAGHEFTDDEIRQSRYYQYLLSHVAKVVLPQDRDRWVKRYDKRLMRKFKSGVDLYKSIEKNGLFAPLEFYAKDGRLYLWKGYRRLVVLNVLAAKKVPVVMWKNERCKKLAKRFQPIPKEPVSIEELARRQFAEHGARATDKYWVHQYTPIYDEVFKYLRNRKISILELGVLRGASLKLWHEAFPRARIYGLDKNKTTWKEFTRGLDRVKVFVGMQEDEKFINNVIKTAGGFDIVVDDCGHDPDQQWAAFGQIWPAVKSHGYYVIEDTFRSFLPRNNGVPNVVRKVAAMADSIYNDQQVASLQFHYNMCVLKKGIEP